MTSLKKLTRRFLSLVLPLALLAAAGDAAAVSAGGVTVDVVATQSWGSGFNGAVRFTNNTVSAGVTSWQVVFKFNGSVQVQGNGWNGTISAPDGSGNVTARNANWVGTIGTGRTVDEGFTANGAFSGVTFVSLTVNGQNVPLGGTGGDTTPPTVSLASSATNVTTAQTITLTATASDSVGVASVQFLDGATSLATDTSSPYSTTVALTSANNGTKTYTARACDAAGNCATSAAVTVTVNIGTTANFTIAASPATLTVNRSASGTSTIAITRTNFTASVSCSASGLPAGVTATFNPTATTGNSTVATFAASSTATLTTANVTVTCTGGSPVISRTATVALTVGQGGSSTFTMAVNPTSLTVNRGASGSSAISLTRTSFTASVSCSATGLPTGVTATFTQPGTGNSGSVALAASTTATLTTANVTVTCTGGSPVVSSTATISLTVGQGGSSTFTMAVAPTTQSVARGASVTSTITLTRTTFTASVSCSATGLPTGVTATFTQPGTGNSGSVALAASSTATVTTTPATVTVTCTGGSPVVSRTATISLSVTGGTGGTGNFAVVNGRVTKDGQPFPVRCGSWFGLQGRYEPAYDSANPRGAPMEQYVGNTFWAATHTRTVMQTMNEIKAAGITVIRLPVVHQTLSGTDPQGNGSLYKNYSGVINDATYPLTNSRKSMESMIKAANAAGIAVMLDIHSCSNYIDWRKGRLDARPPWADATRNDYDFKREDWSCAASGNPSTVTHTQPYNETIWLEDLRTLAGLSQSLGVSNIIGIDIFNEPWDYTWSEWKTLTEHAYQAINAVNPNLLIFVQGISGTAGNQDGTPDTITQTPHGDTATNPNWGENLYPAGADLPAVPVSKLVFSPHTYGPSVFVQKMFMDPAQPNCAGLEGDAAGDAKCNIVINSTLLRSGWEEHFGYLKDLGYSIVVGEFGGNLDWPGGQASTRDQNRYSYLTDKTTDAKWQNAFVDYMVSRKLEGCYWSINPESGDTGGWYGHAYDPISNTGGWGEWRAFDSRKTTLLNRLWSGVP
jgi:aryl-phospho-beta-D-glucosidase BglC (GH1 family)